mgnify:CR=1 FL=1
MSQNVSDELPNMPSIGPWVSPRLYKVDKRGVRRQWEIKFDGNYILTTIAGCVGGQLRES